MNQIRAAITISAIALPFSAPLAADTSVELDFAAGILALQDDAPTASTATGTRDDGEGVVTEYEADPNATNTEALAKAAQNPVADMISLPFQNNFTFPTGPNDNAQWVLNVQPVIPINLTDDINLITRTILPVVNSPSPASGISSDFGIGNLQFTGFLSPAKVDDGLIWGVGPVLQFPTASSARLGSDKWTAGPSLVMLSMQGPWVVGGLVQNVWSYAGPSDAADVNSFLFQPFLNYNMDKGWYLTASPVLTADWNANSDNRWTIPLGGGIGRIMRFGSQPVNMQLQGFYNVVRPDAVGEWTIRFQIQLLFPTG
jgi:hypothetical protein